MKRYPISAEDAARIKHASDLMNANEQVMNITVTRLIHERANALALFNNAWKDIKNKYDIREQIFELYMDFYTNEVKVKCPDE